MQGKHIAYLVVAVTLALASVAYMRWASIAEEPEEPAQPQCYACSSKDAMQRLHRAIDENAARWKERVHQTAYAFTFHTHHEERDPCRQHDRRVVVSAAHAVHAVHVGRGECSVATHEQVTMEGLFSALQEAAQCKEQYTVCVAFDSGDGGVRAMSYGVEDKSSKAKMDVSLSKVVLGMEACAGPCPHVYFPVCGSDGVTYGNACKLRMADCMSPQHISIAHQGACGEQPPKPIDPRELGEQEKGVQSAAAEEKVEGGQKETVQEEKKGGVAEEKPAAVSAAKTNGKGGKKGKKKSKKEAEVCPKNCVIWNDGCNQCVCDTVGKVKVCTTYKKCKASEMETPKCVLEEEGYGGFPNLDDWKGPMEGATFQKQ